MEQRDIKRTTKQRADLSCEKRRDEWLALGRASRLGRAGSSGRRRICRSDVKYFEHFQQHQEQDIGAYHLKNGGTKYNTPLDAGEDPPQVTRWSDRVAAGDRPDSGVDR